jgi:hypothetical protein
MDPVLPEAEWAQPALPSPAVLAAMPGTDPGGDAIAIRPRPPVPVWRPTLPSTVVAVPRPVRARPAAGPMGTQELAATASDAAANTGGEGPAPHRRRRCGPGRRRDPSGLRACVAAAAVEAAGGGERCRRRCAARRPAPTTSWRARRAIQVIADPRSAALTPPPRPGRPRRCHDPRRRSTPREWLNEVNHQYRAREAARRPVGGAVCPAARPGRLAVEADAARITAETDAAAGSPRGPGPVRGGGGAGRTRRWRRPADRPGALVA